MNDVIDKIRQIREKNNRNWMDLMRLAFKLAPTEAASIMTNITECDEEIHTLMKQLAGGKNEQL